MSHQSLITLRPVFGVFLARILDRSRQMIGAMGLGDTANLPQGFFDPLSESLARIRSLQMLTASTLE